MTNTKTTKRALVASVLSIVICLTMLIGSTFAWFTDSATTGVNKITAGNLAVGLEYSTDMENWTNAENATEIFGKDALWEPGYTQVLYFKVTNKGSLALKYMVGTNLLKNVIGATENDAAIDLTKYIKFGIVENVTAKYESRDDAKNAVANPVDFSNLYTAEKSLLSGKSVYFAVVAFMPDTVTNEANHGTGKTAPSLEFGVNVIATQYTEEKDSYDNQYDKDAKIVAVNSQTELVDEITKATAPTEIVLPSGEYTIPSTTNKDLTLSGDKNTVVEVPTGVTATGSTITFKGITVEGAGDSTFYTTQLNGATKVIYEDCTIKGLISTYSDSEFINCEFINTFADQYSVFCYGGRNFTFTGCTFATPCSKAIKLYNEGAHEMTLNVTNCTFNTSTVDKAAIEIDSTYTTKYTVNITNCTIQGSYEKLWNDKSTNSVVTVK